MSPHILSTLSVFSDPPNHIYRYILYIWIYFRSNPRAQSPADSVLLCLLSFEKSNLLGIYLGSFWEVSTDTPQLCYPIGHQNWGMLADTRTGDESHNIQCQTIVKTKLTKSKSAQYGNEPLLQCVERQSIVKTSKECPAMLRDWKSYENLVYNTSTQMYIKIVIR